ncbi:MAG: redoxin domain-containing protein [Candidatus Aenigmarchaeota archaeon]|nr:redoxin domain-containing protein [Candidatus Aenigmarchaeota archaeon]
MLAVGEKAPDFTLKDPDGHDVSLHSLLGGKGILLYFYPADWSSVCTRQLGGFCSMDGQFKSLNIRIVAVSADHADSHKAFRERLGAQFVMLSGTKEVFDRYGICLPNGFANRSYFLLDKDGIIKYMHVMARPDQMMENEELIEKLKNAR